MFMQLYENFKWWIARKELSALARYRCAVFLVSKWNVEVKNSSETATWIHEVGENKRAPDIDAFRERMRSNAGVKRRAAFSHVRLDEMLDASTLRHPLQTR